MREAERKQSDRDRKGGRERQREAETWRERETEAARCPGGCWAARRGGPQLQAPLGVIKNPPARPAVTLRTEAHGTLDHRVGPWINFPV